MISKPFSLFHSKFGLGARSLFEGHGGQELARYSLAIAYFVGLIVWELWDADRSNVPGMAMSLLTVAYLGLLLSVYLRRGPARAIRRGDWFAQAVAFLGANLLIPLSYLPVRNPAMEMVAAVTSCAGLAFSFWAAWHLGTSFSIVPEARKLVRIGPYKWIRHPLYLAGFLIGFGALLVNLSPAALGLFLAFVGSQALRIAYEEETLGKAFPEFRDYRRRTWMLLPRIY